MSDETPPEEPKKRVYGKPFAKGDDPRRNPGGARYRDESGKALTQAMRDYSPKATERLIKIIETGKDRDALNAIALLYNRGFGMASQHLKIDANVTHEVEANYPVELMTPELLKSLNAVRRQMKLAQETPLMIEDASFTEVDPKGIDE